MAYVHPSLPDAPEAMQRSGAAEWKASWPLVFAACIGGAVPTIHYYSLGLFFAPLQAEFGWSRAEISIGVLISATVCVLIQPLIGLLIDRFGSRRVALPGVFIYCGAVTAFATANAWIVSYWALYAVMAFGQACLTQPVWIAAVAKRFTVARGTAISITLCGASIGSLFVPIIAQHAIDAWGWRAAYATLAVVFAAVAFPILFLLFREPVGPAETAQTPRAPAPGLTWREGLRSPYFWCLAGVGLFITLSTQSLLVHFVPIVTAKGLDRSAAAAVIGIVGLTSILGRLCDGFFLDRFRGNVVGAISLLIPLIACILIYSFDGSATMAAAIAMALGFALGAETSVVAYLATRYLGMRNYGILFGLLAGLINLGAGWGPVIAGAVYDAFGSYDRMLMAAGGLSVVFSLLVLRMGPYPVFAPFGGERQAS